MLPKFPLGHWTYWGEQRGGDNLAIVYWLYNLTNEKFLLDYLEKEPGITQSKYCKLAKINSRTAENIIAGFVAIDMVKIVFTKQGVIYTLSDQYTKLTPEQRLKQIKTHVVK